jgi:hypothetical protein
VERFTALQHALFPRGKHSNHHIGTGEGVGVTTGGGDGV